MFRWNLKNDQSEQWIPDPEHSAIQSIDIDPAGQYMAVVNYKVNIYNIIIEAQNEADHFRNEGTLDCKLHW